MKNLSHKQVSAERGTLFEPSCFAVLFQGQSTSQQSEPQIPKSQFHPLTSTSGGEFRTLFKRWTLVNFLHIKLEKRTHGNTTETALAVNVPQCLPTYIPLVYYLVFVIFLLRYKRPILSHHKGWKENSKTYLLPAKDFNDWDDFVRSMLEEIFEAPRRMFLMRYAFTSVDERIRIAYNHATIP